MGKLTCIAGVSGSGKSTLVNRIPYQVYPKIEKLHGSVEADKWFEEVILVDQTTVSKTPRSNPILYLMGGTPLRKL